MDKKFMEEHSFDALAKEMADGTISRSQVLKYFGAAILGSMLGGVMLNIPTAEAKKKKKKKKKRHHGTFSPPPPPPGPPPPPPPPPGPPPPPPPGPPPPPPPPPPGPPPPPPPCNASTCSGCCLGGTCLPGISQGVCGSGGVICRNCGTGKCCGGDLCAPPGGQCP